VISKVAKSDDSKKAAAIKPTIKSETWFRKLIRKIQWRAHWLLPNIISAVPGDDSTFYKESDVKSNLESRVPDTEELRVQVIWGAEVYGPSETDSLCENLARLRWTAGSGSGKRGGAADWVRRQRSYGEGGWYNVGTVASPSDRHKFILPTNELRLPEKVEYLIVQIFQLTPALTCVVIGFALKENLSIIYESELKKSRVGHFERFSKRSTLRLSPDQLKNRSIIKSREAVRSIAQTWFQSNLPGYFCSSDIHRLPTAELITTATEPLLPGEKVRFNASEHWKSIIASSPPYDVWSSPDGTGVRFTSDRNGLKDEPLHLIVSLCKSDVSDDAIKYRGKRSNRVFISHSADLMAGIISNFASIGFLTETLKNLRLSRASLEIHKVNRGKGLHALEKIQAFFDRSLGTPAIAAELRSRSEHMLNFVHDCSIFTAPNWRAGDSKRTIAEELCGHSNSLAKQVITEEHSLREHLEQLSSIISVRESIKAQRRMEVLTIGALLVAVASMAIAVIQNSEWSKAMAVFLTNLLNI